MSELYMCIHCEADVPEDIKDHWESCESHPAHQKVAALQAKLKDVQEVAEAWAKDFIGLQMANKDLGRLIDQTEAELVKAQETIQFYAKNNEDCDGALGEARQQRDAALQQVAVKDSLNKKFDTLYNRIAQLEIQLEQEYDRSRIPALVVEELRAKFLTASRGYHNLLDGKKPPFEVCTHVSCEAARRYLSQPLPALVEQAQARIAALEHANRTRPDYDLRCQDCGRAHILDTVIPSDIWNQIVPEPEIGLLCTTCIDDRLVKAGLAIEAKFYYAGTALNSKLYADDIASVEEVEQARKEREAAALAHTLVDVYSQHYVCAHCGFGSDEDHSDGCRADKLLETYRAVRPQEKQK